jgi:hypothetical protein
MILLSSVSVLNACISCLEMESTFMKHSTYNGVCITAILKTGDYKNVPITFGLFPTKTTDNYIWMFLKMKASGVPFEKLAVFCDEGKQINAAKLLQLYDCNWLHIKNCTYHIAKNVCARYKPKDTV